MGERIRDKGQGINRPTRTLCVVLLFILYPLSFILSQESPATTPKPGARLQFVPPPMEGTISMGIYDGGGKLVRALHREEEVQSDAFGKALNGLITSWDGKNDAGETMPAGRYFARGFMVGDIGTEGEAMHGNDWVTDDDSPRIFRINGLRIEFESYIVFAQIAGAKQTIRMELDARGYILSTQTFDEAIKEELQKDSVYKHIGRNEPRGGDRLSENPLKIEGRKITISTFTGKHTFELADGESVVDACAEWGNSVWLVVRNAKTSEVREYSPEGEFKRRLAIQAEELQPVKIAASPNRLFFLEQSSTMQRLRALSLLTNGPVAVSGTEPAPTWPATTSTAAAIVSGTEPATSTWKVLFSKTITFSDTLDQARGLLKFPDGKPFEPQDKIRVTLLPNPLVQDQPGAVEISAGIDAEGSFLKTTDGLLLKRISDTTNLKWAAIGRETGSKTIVLFQSDGAVVEEYRISRPANMMAFDCGDFEFDPAKMK